MIVTDSFVFLHLHKSGGTFINQLLLTCVPSAQRLGYHLPFSELPDTFHHLPVVGTVRNPWAYYVSWYHFQKAQAFPNPLYLIASEGGKLAFAPTITKLLTLHDNPVMIEQLAEAFPETFQRHGINLTKACVRRILGSNKGFYSYLHDRLYAGSTPTVIRSEGMRTSFRPFVSHPLAHNFLEKAPDMNTSRHIHYRDYYDEALRKSVATAEAGLISAYGYVF